MVQQGTGATAVTRAGRRRERRGYRGPDRRAVRTAAPVFPTSTTVIALAVLTGACVVAAWAGLLDSAAETVRLARLDAAASALGILAGAAFAVRWKVDGAAPAWWAGIGVLAVSIPGIATNTGSSAFSALYLSCALVALVCFALAIASPAVDTSIRPVLVIIGAVIAVGALSGITDALLGGGDGGAWHQFLLAALFALVAGVTARRRRAVPDLPCGPLVTVLAGLAGAALVAGVAAGDSVLQVGGPAMLRLVTFAVAAVGALAELHAASAVQRDAAYRSRLEREASEAERRTIEARFAERMHEVRSTIAVLAGSVRRLDTDTTPDTGASGTLAAAMASEIERLRHLVAVDQERAPQRAGIFDLRATLEPMLTVSEAGGWPVSWELPVDLAVRGNAADVAQIVHGLLANATRYAPGTPIEVGAARDGRFVVVTVEDRGPGVPRGARDLVFERGERAAEPSDPAARGLGLYIARRMARDGGGDLWVESRLGGGARFVVSMPAVATAHENDPAADAPPTPVTHLRRAFRTRSIGRGARPAGDERSA